MRSIIVAGGRNFTDRSRVFEVLNEFTRRGDEILHGACPTGADAFAQEWCECKDFAMESYPADWDFHGKAAGPLRNAEIAENGDVLIAFWNGGSRGTRSMINESLKAGLEIHVYRY